MSADELKRKHTDLREDRWSVEKTLIRNESLGKLKQTFQIKKKDSFISLK